MEMNKPMIRRILGFMMSVSLLLGLLPGMSLTAHAQETSASGDSRHRTRSNGGTADGWSYVEIGDGTLEMRDIPHVLQMLELFIKDGSMLEDMCENILQNKKMGVYNGAYKAVELAMKLKEADAESGRKDAEAEDGQIAAEA